VPDRPGLHNDPARRLATLRRAACAGPLEVRARFEPGALSKTDAAILKGLAGGVDLSGGKLRLELGYDALRRLVSLSGVAVVRDGSDEEPQPLPLDGIAAGAGASEAVGVIVDLGGPARAAARAVLAALPADAVLESDLLPATAQLILSLKTSALARLNDIPVVCAVYPDAALRLPAPVGPAKQ
jgi:hypothetical protein